MKITLSIILLFISINLFSQNGLENGNLFILPKNKNAITLNKFEADKIIEIKKFPINKNSIFSTNQKNLVGILNRSNKKISIYNIETEKKLRLSIPFDIKPKSLLIDDNNIFIGGEMENEMLIQYNFHNQKWYSLEIPEEIKFPGKSIDDIVINDNYLIAIDNIIIPKYILYYHINSDNKLIYSHQRSLKFNSSYESTHFARLENELLGLYSTTFNWGTFSEHITVYRGLDLKESFAISSDYTYKSKIVDIILIEGNLYVANSSKGLGKLKIEDNFFKAKDEYGWEESNPQLDENLINYQQYTNEEIIKLTKIPNANTFIVTLKDKNGNYRNEIR